RCAPVGHTGRPPAWERPATGAWAALCLDCVRFANHRHAAGTLPVGRMKTITIIRAPYRIHWTAGAAIGRTITGRKPKMIPPTIGPARVPLPPVITMITIVTV